MFFSLNSRWKIAISIPFLIAGISIFILFFSNGCNFDPYKDTVQSDTATYNITGTVKNTNNDGIQGILVCLLDSTTNTNSKTVETDSAGHYTLNDIFIRKNSLQMKFTDKDPKSNGNYDSTVIPITFNDNDFRYHFQKTQNATLYSK